jgi:hypothetical protein
MIRFTSTALTLQQAERQQVLRQGKVEIGQIKVMIAKLSLMRELTATEASQSNLEAEVRKIKEANETLEAQLHRTKAAQVSGCRPRRGDVTCPCVLA